MPAPTPSASGSSFFASMTASDWVTAIIAISSLIVALLAFCIPLWKSRTRLEVLDTYSQFCDVDLAILDLVLVNKSCSSIAITGIGLVGKVIIPARRFSQDIPDIGSKERGYKIRENTIEFPITLAPYESKRVIAGFNQGKYGEHTREQIFAARKRNDSEKPTKKLITEMKKIRFYTSRKDITITVPFKVGDMG
jgi:hypothetical protein